MRPSLPVLLLLAVGACGSAAQTGQDGGGGSSAGGSDVGSGGAIGTGGGGNQGGGGAGGGATNLGASYSCETAGAPSASTCVVGQSLCQIDHGHGGASGSGVETTTWTQCRNVPEPCATTPTCGCICSRIGCSVVTTAPTSPSPGCTCTGTNGFVQVICYGV